jgi:outer membrane lipoprotein
MFNQMRIMPYILQTTLLITICGCAYPISQEMRAKANPDLIYSAVARDPRSYKGATIIWGGIVIQVQNQPSQTVLTILETPLDYYGVPLDEDFSRGRFIAQVPEYLDQQAYGEGKKIILAGDIVGEETKQLAGTQYRYPVVLVRELHQFLQRDNSQLYRPNDYPDQYGYPYYDQSPFKGIQ